MNSLPESWPLSGGGAVRPSCFFGAISLSLIFYFIAFGYVFHKPQTIGRTRDLYAIKDKQLSAHATEPKVVIVAGSNAMVSHSAKTFTETLGLPSVNMGVSASLSIDFQLARIKPYLQRGDVIYLPLEYGQLARDIKAVYSGAEAPYMVAYEQSSLANFSPMRRLHARLYFDLNFLFSSVAEMALTALDFERRITADDFNAWGDQTGHTLDKGAAYREYVNSISAYPAVTVNSESYAARAVANFLEWATENGVVVVGGWPTYAEGEAVTAEAESSLKGFYQSRGHYFLDLENKGRYPKSHFFDTIYHLAEPYQIEHSRLVAEHLIKLLKI